MKRALLQHTFGRVGLASLVLAGSVSASAVAATLAAGPAAASTTTELASVGPGGEAPDGYSFVEDMSADGSVVFLSSSVSFIGGVGTNWFRAYLRSGSTTTAITPTPGFSVERAGISDNGRFVVYVLGPGEPPAVYLYDTVDQTTTQVLTIGSAYPQFVSMYGHVSASTPSIWPSWPSRLALQRRGERQVPAAGFAGDDDLAIYRGAPCCRAPLQRRGAVVEPGRERVGPFLPRALRNSTPTTTMPVAASSLAPALVRRRRRRQGSPCRRRECAGHPGSRSAALPVRWSNGG